MKLLDLLSPASLKIKTLLGWAGAWAGLLFIGSRMLREYLTQGYYRDYKHGIDISGKGAELAVWAITTMSAFLFFYFCVLVVVALYRKLNTKEAFWCFFLYPLEGFESPKPVFIPPETGPKWAWGAFIIPEVWFLWHEIWTASILAVVAEAVTLQTLDALGFGLYGDLASFLFVRIIAGLWGHRIYYFKYGHSLKTGSNQEGQESGLGK